MCAYFELIQYHRRKLDTIAGSPRIRLFKNTSVGQLTRIGYDWAPNLYDLVHHGHGERAEAVKLLVVLRPKERLHQYSHENKRNRRETIGGWRLERASWGYLTDIWPWFLAGYRISGRSYSSKDRTPNLISFKYRPDI